MVFTWKAFGTPCQTRSNSPTRGTEAGQAKKEGIQDGDADAEVETRSVVVVFLEM